MVPISEASGMCSDNMLANKVITVRTQSFFDVVFIWSKCFFSKLGRHFPRFSVQKKLS